MTTPFGRRLPADRQCHRTPVTATAVLRALPEMVAQVADPLRPVLPRLPTPESETALARAAPTEMEALTGLETAMPMAMPMGMETGTEIPSTEVAVESRVGDARRETNSTTSFSSCPTRALCRHGMARSN